MHRITAIRLLIIDKNRDFPILLALGSKDIIQSHKGIQSTCDIVYDVGILPPDRSTYGPPRLYPNDDTIRDGLRFNQIWLCIHGK